MAYYAEDFDSVYYEPGLLDRIAALPLVVRIGAIIILLGAWLVYYNEKTATISHDVDVVAYAVGQKIPVRVKVSHYWPDWGGPNCYKYDAVNKKCLSGTRFGGPVSRWVDKGAACPEDMARAHAKVKVFGKVYTCVDTGGAITYLDDSKTLFWIDLLQKKSPVPYGTILNAELVE